MPPQNAQEKVRGWFAGRVPDGWFVEPPEVTIDRDEVLVVGRLAEPAAAEGAGEEERNAARRARVQGFREDTRDRRMRIAEEAQARLGRRVSWGAECGDTRVLFTTVGAPVMTRLRMDERAVLDTLVDASVARSRSEALAWCVRLVAQHQGEWISQLRDALVHVEKVRSEGPS